MFSAWIGCELLREAAHVAHRALEIVRDDPRKGLKICIGARQLLGFGGGLGFRHKAGANLAAQFNFKSGLRGDAVDENQE